MKHTLLFFFSFCNSFGYAQNLVPNYSFEEYTDCPMGYPDLDGKCNHWTSFRGSPDYINNCSPVCGYNNQWSYQLPRIGQAYVTFYNYEKNFPNRTEQIGVELLSPLEVGVRYYVSFYVSLAYRLEAANIATNKIGAKFTTYQYNDPNLILQLPNNCQIYTNEIITDTLNWVKISGSFVADSAYRFLIIGGFFDGALIDKFQFPYSIIPIYSYYFLDDVCVSTDASLCEVTDEECDFKLPIAFSPNGDNVNDEYKWIQNCSDVDEFTMHIYNRWGQIVFSTNDYNISWDGNYNGKPQPTDVYAVYVSVFSNNKQINKSINITLLR